MLLSPRSNIDPARSSKLNLVRVIFAARARYFARFCAVPSRIFSPVTIVIIIMVGKTMPYRSIP